MFKKRKNKVNYSVEEFSINRDIKIWMKKNNIKGISFGEILFKLGLEPKVDIKLKSYFSLRCSSLTDTKPTFSVVYYIDGEYIEHTINFYDGVIVLGDVSIGSFAGFISKKEFSFSTNVGNKFILEKKFERFDSYDGFDKYMRNTTSGDITIEAKQHLYEQREYNEMLIIIECDTRKVQIENEEALKDYLLRVDLTTSIDEIYNTVCQIANIDEDKCSLIKIILGMTDYPMAALVYSNDMNTGEKRINVLNRDENKKYYSNITEASNVKCINDLDDSGIIEIVNGDYKFVLYLRSVSKIKIDNECYLREYLLNLQFPVSLREVYEVICDVSLRDISRYNEIKLCYYYKNNIVDTLHVVNNPVDSDEKISVIEGEVIDSKKRTRR